MINEFIAKHIPILDAAVKNILRHQFTIIENTAEAFRECLALHVAEKLKTGVVYAAPDSRSLFRRLESLNALNELAASAFIPQDGPEIETSGLASENILFLKDLLDSKNGGRPKIHLLCSDSLCVPCPLPENLSEHYVCIAETDPVPENLFRRLVGLGYNPGEPVTRQGEYARRGSVIDLFGFSSANPVRAGVEFNRFTSLRLFDPQTQRSVQSVKEYTAAAYASVHTAQGALSNYISKDSVVLLENPSGDQIMASLEEAGARVVCLYSFSASDQTKNAHGRFDAKTSEPDTLIRAADPYGSLKEASGSKKIVIACASNEEICKMEELLRFHKIKGPLCVLAPVRGGFCADGFALLTPECLVKSGFHYKPKKISIPMSHSITMTELSEGDYVVHVDHGIGKFLGIENVQTRGAARECFVILYADNARLYVPVDQCYTLEKYIALTKKAPQLSPLGGTAWRKTKIKVQQKIMDYAADLLKIQAERETRTGFKYSADSDWQREFEDSFIYDETQDQLKAIAEVKADMQRQRPMDRLVCGDAGYGKTEIAMRAAFKAVMDGKQVAMLVPTTVLAQQHYLTFIERFKTHPVAICLLSRFSTSKQSKSSVKDIRDGRIDIVIGTHKLLHKNIFFKDLGLLIIDEEQRFGVRHKEHLKKLRATVDVLTLTATPIPRTLYMSLSGIKDISYVNTPPKDRMPINTYISVYSDQLVEQALARELKRGGQVFYIYNRINSIHPAAARIRRLAPCARVSVAHGQMEKTELRNIMLEFMNGNIDILVCTTIIESGMDISNANTIIIENADMFGLADLYQLRGRVGRSAKEAYCCLLLPSTRPALPGAVERLKTIQQTCAAGSGMTIALRDLEMRGCGNLVGRQQHGQIQQIGLDLYCRLLKKAVSMAHGKDQPEDIETKIDIGTPLHIPAHYVSELPERLSLYRRMATSSEPKHIDLIQEELIDRYGEIEYTVRLLLRLHRLRIDAKALNISDITARHGQIVVTKRGASQRFSVKKDDDPSVIITELEAVIKALKRIS